MGLLDRLKRKKDDEEINEPMPEPTTEPEPEPYVEPEPEPYVEPAPEPEPATTQEYAEQYPQDLQLQQPAQQQQPVVDYKHQLELISSKLDMLRLQLDNLNQAITVINAKLK